MIHCTKESTRIEGTILDTAQDVVNILVAVRKVMLSKVNDDATNKAISLMGQIAFEEDTDKIEVLSKDLLDTLQNGKRADLN